MLELQNISLSYGEMHALNNISLTINSGEICSILGPSGCGKTSMLNILAGNIKHYKGKVTLNGLAIDNKQKCIGFISQDYGLLPWKTVYKNVILPFQIKRLNIESRAEKIENVINKLGIDDIKKRYPISLSGGQKQRVAIAGAFVIEPDLLLMDEPFSALDQVTKESTQELFFDVWNETKPTTVFVTHSIEEAVFMGQKIVILSKSPGSIIKIIDNPTFGKKDVRISNDYLDICKDIRGIIKNETS